MKPRDLKQKLKEIPLFDYVEYRDVLHTMFQIVKGSMNGGSWLDLAEILGFSRTNALWLAAERRRKLTDLTSKRICDHLGWQGETRRYWILMVLANNERDGAKRESLMNRLMELKKQSLGDGPDALAMEYFSEWYHPIIRELARIRTLTTEPESTMKELLPQLLPAEAKSSLDLLQRLGLVTIDKESGNVMYSGENILPSRRVSRHASIRFHHAMMELAKEAIVSVRKDRKEFNGLTLGLSTQGVEEAKRIIQKACADVMALESNDEKGQHLYQMNVQLFPFTHD